MKKIIPVLLCVSVLAGLVACGAPKPHPDSSTAFHTAAPDPLSDTGSFFTVVGDNTSTAPDSDPQRITLTRDTAAALRFPLDGSLWADEVSACFLRLKLVTPFPGQERPRLMTQQLTAPWVRTEPFVPDPALWRATELSFEADDWVRLDITEFAQAWLSGTPNHGLALRLDLPTDLEDVVFYSGGVGEEASDWKPVAEFVYQQKEHPAAVSRFAFSPETEGNCLSYALRDTNPIYLDALGLKFPELTEAFRRGGAPALLDLMTEKIKSYVSAHPSLLVSALRPLDQYDSPIDPETEYRIALRVGTHPLEPENPVLDDHSFDYHLWTQVGDGRWAQKFPQDTALRIPGSHGDYDPEGLPWDAALDWANAKFQGYYQSPVRYFAVTKTTEQFTIHKS